MGSDKAPRSVPVPSRTLVHHPGPAGAERAAERRTGLVESLLDLQRLAGNSAVTTALAAVQREEATAVDSPFAHYAEQWPSLVTDRLVEATNDLATHPQIALLKLHRALAFVVEVFDAIPADHPVKVKVRIFGRGLAGSVEVLDDRLGFTKDPDKERTDDLRTWRYQANELGPQLKAGPNGQPANLENWNQGVVYPLGRAILKSGQEPAVAVSEASLALEVVRMWRDGTPRTDPNRLKLVNLERGVSITLDRLREAAYGAGEVDVAKNLETAVAESNVVGPQIATIQPPPPAVSTPSAAGPQAPFVNDTELMRP